MNVLILEDDPGRIRIFKRNLIGAAKVSCVETVEAAINELQTSNWDYLFLDHDLGGDVYVPSGPGTGYEVAEWLEQNPKRQPSNIIIHSLNSVGAQNIKRALPRATIAPGCWTSLEIK